MFFELLSVFFIHLLVAFLYVDSCALYYDFCLYDLIFRHSYLEGYLFIQMIIAVAFGMKRTSDR